jgi:hypothetical protein
MDIFLKRVDVYLSFVSEYRLILETIGKPNLTGEDSTCGKHVLCANWTLMASSLCPTMVFHKKVNTRHTYSIESIHVLVCYKRTTLLMKIIWLCMILIDIRSQK